jgi:DNA-binding response OmpR family regulator
VARVLLVEDEDGVRHALQRGLEHGEFAVVAVASADEALAVEAGTDLALIDLGLPDRDGVELCRELRLRRPDRPIIVVTGRRDELDVVDALDAGADDYVTKPYSLAVLIARVRRHLDRAADTTVIGELRVERAARRASLGGVALDLSPREFDVLAMLAARAGDAVGKKELVAAVWDEHWSKSTHTVSVHVSALRRKLREAGSHAPIIETVAGAGYRLAGTASKR